MSPSGTPRGTRALPRLPLAAAVLLVAFSGPVRAEVYQWTDEAGTIHFTDDLSSVPPALRGKTRPLRREAPITVQSPPPAAYAPAPSGGPQSDSGDAQDVGDVWDPVTEAEQLRAKIAAKEQLIDSVDRKRSLATNPLRNRFVNPTDMDLYRKYQAELPGDRERLKALEAGIDTLNR